MERERENVDSGMHVQYACVMFMLTICTCTCMYMCICSNSPTIHFVCVNLQQLVHSQKDTFFSFFCGDDGFCEVFQC